MARLPTMWMPTYTMILQLDKLLLQFCTSKPKLQLMHTPKDTFWNPIIESGKQLQPNTSHPIGKMAKATLLTSSANIGSLQLCGPCSSLSCSGGARLQPSLRGVTEFRQPLHVQSHLEMPGILVQLGHIQHT